jgi:hypothetical protein
MVQNNFLKKGGFIQFKVFRKNIKFRGTFIRCAKCNLSKFSIVGVRIPASFILFRYKSILNIIVLKILARLVLDCLTS